jgi:hypothetical protein
MAYEIFTRKSQRMGSPTLSFSKIGQVVFNQIAALALQKDAIEHVLFLWDASERKFAMKATSNKKDPRAYRLRFAEKGNGAATSAKTFLDYIGMDYSERRSVPIEINTNAEYIVEIKLPEAFFKKRPQQPLPFSAEGKIKATG